MSVTISDHRIYLKIASKKLCHYALAVPRCEIQVSYAIGVAHPTSIAFETFGAASIDEDSLRQLIDEHFDLRPAAIIDRFQLKRPIYEQTAAYGHFGRTDIDLPWEALDVVAALRQGAGLPVA